MRARDLAGFALALGAGHALGVTTVTPSGAVGVSYGPGYAKVLDGADASGFVVRNVTAGAGGGRNVGVAEQHLLRVGGRDLTATASRQLAPAAVGRASALALRALPVIGTGVLLWDIFDAVRVRPDGAGGLVADPGVNQETVSGWKYSTRTPQNSSSTATGYVFNSGAEVCSDQLSRITAWDTNGAPHGCTITMSGGHPVSLTITRKTGWYYDGSILKQSSNVTQCPASIDPLDPQYNVPAGGPVGPDGKCRTARYYHQPITAPDAAARLETMDPPSSTELRDLAQDALARGQSIEATGDRQMSGPASVTGTPTTTTTTNPDGSTTVTTKTPATSYTYSGDQITYNITTTTVTNTTIGGTTTTTTTVTNEAGDEVDREDPCIKNPGTVGCAKLGDLPTDAPVWQTVTVPWASEDLGFTGACPAPVTWNVFGMALTWSYQKVCDVAPMVRLALLVIASIGAVSVVVRETAA